jgi:hypothetical protein
MGRTELNMEVSAELPANILQGERLLDVIGNPLGIRNIALLSMLRKSACWEVWKRPLSGTQILESGVLTEAEAIVACENGISLPDIHKGKQENLLEPLKWLERIKNNSGISYIVGGGFDLLTLGHVWEMFQAKISADKKGGQVFMLVEPDEYIQTRKGKAPILRERQRVGWGDNSFVDWATVWPSGVEKGMRSWELGLELISRYGGNKTRFVLPEPASWMSATDQQLLKMRAEQIFQAGCEVEWFESLENTSSSILKRKFNLM